MDSFMLFLWFVRHFNHKDNLPLTGEDEKARLLGHRIRVYSAEHGIPLPLEWYSSPQMRAVSTGTYLCEGAEKAVILSGTSPAIGDMVMGEHALTSLEVNCLKQQAATAASIPFDDYIVTGEATRELMYLRGIEGAKFVRQTVADFKRTALDAQGRGSILYTGHGGRWETTCDRLVDKDADRPPHFVMRPCTAAFVTATVTRSVVSYGTAHYLGDLSPMPDKGISHV